ncbi:Succinyl-CoA:coenzyme A transferase [Variovorax sp. PBL-H6]|uniref:acetyl-CoA hydrolase/transferase family protein n=1 Tax=Variovorax sp. PBL-H6 TaxID=434009 RepID=UPI0013190E7C|nr:acetyl-CoA hydrolase/transferase family protein [Variovorax sp. PBL-H6]VTU21496.1 Succinyl-CoA:coenzyme A transferase [Variovorax sp. PBL-H6]
MGSDLTQGVARPGAAPSLPAAATLDLARWIRAGDTLMWGQASAEPATLVRAYAEQRHDFARTRAFLGIGLTGLLDAQHADAIDFIGYCGSGTNRRIADAGVLEILPCHYSDLPAFIRSGALRIDVLLLQVPPADEQGRHSLGLAHEYLLAALDIARVVIAEVNAQMPWTCGDRLLQPEEIDLRVEASYPPSPVPATQVGDRERAIAAHVAALVEDGATLQCGLGAIPEAVLGALRGRRDLGIHSGAVGDAVVELIEAGAVTNARKGRDTGTSIAGVLLGGTRLHRYAHNNPALQLRGTEYTHHPEVLASLSRLAAINSAVEVDLTGQVNSEVAAGSYVGAVGGAVDFLRGAQRSRGGVPVVALPSTAGAHSRIVARLSGPVSTPRCDAGVFVTEYGVADLRGAPLAARMRRMIDIAHPSHRARLEQEGHQAARSLGWR